jgi:hypothetical protein
MHSRCLRGRKNRKSPNPKIAQANICQGYVGWDNSNPGCHRADCRAVPVAVRWCPSTRGVRPLQFVSFNELAVPREVILKWGFSGLPAPGAEIPGNTCRSYLECPLPRRNQPAAGLCSCAMTSDDDVATLSSGGVVTPSVHRNQQVSEFGVPWRQRPHWSHRAPRTAQIRQAIVGRSRRPTAWPTGTRAW